jgi:hypothetical protein
MSLAQSAIAPSLLPAAAITKGRLIERVTDAGVEKAQHYNAANTIANAQRFAGVAAETHDGTGTRPVMLYGIGQLAPVTSGGIIAATDYFLTSDNAGKLVAAAAGDIVTCLNVYGLTTGGADETINVYICPPSLWVV